MADRRYKNLYAAFGRNEASPFGDTKTVFLVIDRKDCTVRYKSRRSSDAAVFSLPVPAWFKAQTLSALADEAVRLANKLLLGDARPEARYELEMELSRRITLSEIVESAMKEA